MGRNFTLTAWMNILILIPISVNGNIFALSFVLFPGNRMRSEGSLVELFFYKVSSDALRLSMQLIATAINSNYAITTCHCMIAINCNYNIQTSLSIAIIDNVIALLKLIAIVIAK